MTTLVVLQPGYLPWLGFFEQMWRSNIFVLYDDVRYDKNGWRNRNRIKTPQGPTWLTVPVAIKGREAKRICDVEIDGRAPWARKHVRTIRQHYAKAPFLDTYLPELEDCLTGEWSLLADLDLALIEILCRWLGLNREVFCSSRLDIPGERSQRLVDLCRHFGADIYYSGASGKDYLDQDLFHDHGIAVEFQDYQHPVYPQLHGDFVSYLSVLDLVLNVGGDALSVLTSQGETTE